MITSRAASARRADDRPHPPEPGIARPTSRWADAALAGLLVNLLALLVTPVVRPDLDPLKASLSYYAEGAWGWLQTAGFVAMGMAAIALAIALASTDLARQWRGACAALLVLGGIASLGLVLFPMGASGPMTPIGDVHQTAGTLGAALLLGATVAFWRAARGSAANARLAALAVAACVVGLLCALVAQIALWDPELGIPLGAAIRLLVASQALFWGSVALQARRRSTVLPSAGSDD